MARYVIERYIEAGYPLDTEVFYISEVDEEGESRGSLGKYATLEEAKQALPNVKWRKARASWQPDTVLEGVEHDA